ncbi:Mobile element protein [Candidatus Enterovibrio escicola]|uniref:Mobile element protein n=1 Tax=Candidatus Enterovibrio escicola TaxID=1927127 RepID=A0A2A5T441_9GAMM|nr:Mobile element protein [Candidatus Enterovibrio escacola]
MHNSDAVFTDIADFCQVLLPAYKKHRISNFKTKNRAYRFSIGEVMTIIIFFYQSGFRYFKM